MGICLSVAGAGVRQKGGDGGGATNNGERIRIDSNNQSASSPTKPDINAMVIKPKDVEDFRQEAGNCDVNIFSYSEMRAITRNFRPDQVLGVGGFGTVYKGVIDENIRPGFKSTEVAVKELNPEGFQGDKEWLVHVTIDGLKSRFLKEQGHRLLFRTAV